MTYVVQRTRHGGPRYEIRESELTDRGPRARSLASFRVLDDAVLAKARARALRPFDPIAVRRSARRVGAPVEDADPVERNTRALLSELVNGAGLAPALAALLRRVLPAGDAPDDSVEAMLPWAGATAAERGAALRDLLLLGDRLPVRLRSPLAFPRLQSAQ
jgi:hypothetical protein